MTNPFLPFDRFKSMSDFEKALKKLKPTEEAKSHLLELCDRLDELNARGWLESLVTSAPFTWSTRKGNIALFKIMEYASSTENWAVLDRFISTLSVQPREDVIICWSNVQDHIQTLHKKNPNGEILKWLITSPSVQQNRLPRTSLLTIWSITPYDENKEEGSSLVQLKNSLLRAKLWENVRASATSEEVLEVMFWLAYELSSYVSPTTLQIKQRWLELMEDKPVAWFKDLAQRWDQKTERYQSLVLQHCPEFKVLWERACLTQATAEKSNSAPSSLSRKI